jgi:hypothetical protein
VRKRLSYLIALAAVLGFTLGCESIGTKLLRSENAHAYYLSQFTDACAVENPPAPCLAEQKLLNKWKQHALEASFIDWPPEDPKVGPKHPRLGPIPLQLKGLKADEKATKKSAAEVAKTAKKVNP